MLKFEVDKVNMEAVSCKQPILVISWLVETKSGRIESIPFSTVSQIFYADKRQILINVDNILSVLLVIYQHSSMTSKATLFGWNSYTLEVIGDEKAKQVLLLHIV